MKPFQQAERTEDKVQENLEEEDDDPMVVDELPKAEDE